MTGHLGERILIADDDAAIRGLLAASLRKQGYRTTAACDGGEALEAMRAGEADLILLDLRMPKVTGWDVLAARALSTELRKIPVIVITAERGDGAANVLDEGICAFLAKPFDLTLLHVLVKSCLLEHI